MKVSAQNIDRMSAELYRRAGLISEVMPQIAALVQEEIDENFISYGRWNGTTTDILSGGENRWTPLADSTKRRYKAQGKSNLNPTLSRSAGGLAQATTVVAQGMRVAISVKKVYAAAQNFGVEINHPGGTPYINLNNTVRFIKKDGKYPDGVKFTKPHIIKIPARPFVTISRQTLADISELIARRLSS